MITDNETESIIKVQQSVIPVSPTIRYAYKGVHSAVYHANIGQGLLRHEHTFAHTTMCVQGRIVIRKEGKQIQLICLDAPLLLIANEWHEIEAVEPNTIFINQSTINEVV